ncbi:hypothetical protein BDV18DRAFT_156844 [Aspergillus unguis]
MALSILLTLITLIQTTSATCPPATTIVYSPFKPYFKFPLDAFGPNPLDFNCWSGAICTFEAADEARKQQFAATALVMGLLPLVLRDIAWPERRVVLVSRPLPVLLEVLVRALGVEPVGRAAGRVAVADADADADGDTQTRRWVGWVTSSPLTRGVVAISESGRSATRARILVAFSTLVLLVSYAALALVEIYSKRSALGCVYPVIALTWCIVALIPGAIHVFARTRCAGSSKNQAGRKVSTSAVQGGDEVWFVQFAWAVYYIIGTLVFTSIMAVTPIELFVWVVTMAAVTASSKLLALYVCLLVRNPCLGGEIE